MIIAKVKGNITSTRKDPCLVGFKIMLVEPLDLNGLSLGKEFLAVDTVDAGIHDIVLLCMEGGSVSVVMKKTKAACDAAIVGVIDSINFDKGYR
jgi:microcompartment protein CcmK/EutM